MTQKERQLLLKDLCARLPYGIICRKDCKTVDNEDFYLDEYPYPIELAKYLTIDDMDITIKPYLRPMSSMTEEEKEELRQRFCYEWEESVTELMYYSIEIGDADYFIDWLNSHHFDYRGLIEKGLALESPEDMYDLKSF